MEDFTAKLQRLNVIARAIGDAMSAVSLQFDLDKSEKARIYEKLKAAHDELDKVAEEIWARQDAEA